MELQDLMVLDQEVGGVAGLDAADQNLVELAAALEPGDVGDLVVPPLELAVGLQLRLEEGVVVGVKVLVLEDVESAVDGRARLGARDVVLRPGRCACVAEEDRRRRDGGRAAEELAAVQTAVECAARTIGSLRHDPLPFCALRCAALSDHRRRDHGGGFTLVQRPGDGLSNVTAAASRTQRPAGSRYAFVIS